MLRWASAGGAVPALDSYGQARSRPGPKIFWPLGIRGRVHRAASAGDSNFHRAACGSGAHAAGTVSSVHVSGIVAVVPGAGVSRDEAGGELARAGEILSQVRCGDWGGAGGGRGVVCLGSLAE